METWPGIADARGRTVEDVGLAAGEPFAEPGPLRSGRPSAAAARVYAMAAWSGCASHRLRFLLAVRY